jgi:hemoglobin
MRDACLQAARRNSAPTFYDSLGGDPVMRKLADHFIAGAAADPELRPLLGADPRAVADRLYATLVAYWGGGRPLGSGSAETELRRAKWVPPQSAEAAWLARLRSAAGSVGCAPASHAVLSEYVSRLGFSFL